VSRDIVIDASVSATWILEDEGDKGSEGLLAAVLRGDVRLLQPTLWQYEMLNVVRSAVVRGRLSERKARQAVATLRAVPVQTVAPEEQGQADILSLALEMKLSAYDAAYVSLARQRGADLVSADQRILGLRSQLPWVRPLDEFCRDVLSE